MPPDAAAVAIGADTDGGCAACGWAGCTGAAGTFGAGICAAEIVAVDATFDPTVGRGLVAAVEKEEITGAE